MGINKLLPEFPGGPMTSAKAGFDLLNPLLQGDEMRQLMLTWELSCMCVH
mgnify:CR=1 FL=1